MRSLTVLSVAYPFNRVGRDAVGGSEQIVAALDSALTKAGHRSIVVAVEGSTVTGKLIPTPTSNGLLNGEAPPFGQHQNRAAIAGALKTDSVDLIHMHSLDFYRYLPNGKTPVL